MKSHSSICLQLPLMCKGLVQTPPPILCSGKEVALERSVILTKYHICTTSQHGYKFFGAVPDVLMFCLQLELPLLFFADLFGM